MMEIPKKNRLFCSVGRKDEGMMNEKKQIAVLFGGCSPEYGVSLQSACAVIRHMDRSVYVPVLIGITKQGDWFHFHGSVEKIAYDTWHNDADCTPAAVSPSRSEHVILTYTSAGVQKLPIDAAFPVLHGQNGEDGTVQALFTLAGIPLVGCGVLASALCMDKDRAHRLARAAGVAVPRSFILDRNGDMESAFPLAEELGYPLFVKPVKAGSSFGVTKVAERPALSAAIHAAFSYDDHVIVEEAIPGFEVGCAVLGNDELTVGEVDEIELADGFFDFTEKYTLKTSAIHVPARIDAATAQRVKQTARTIYKALDCRGFARVDLFLTGSGEIVFNEVNTIPGFTSHSRFPTMLKAVGISFEQVISRAIELAVEP